MSILITRPEKQALQTQADLNALGLETHIAPVLNVQPLPHTLPEDAQGYILTSANAIDNATATDKALPVYCVGPQTAQAATEAGHTYVQHADGNAEDLARMIKGQEGLAHLCGRHVTEPLGDYQIIVYETHVITQWPADTLQALRDGQISTILVYSTRSAQALKALIDHHGLHAYICAITLLSISAPVLDYLSQLSWAKRVHAQKPNKDSILQALRSIES